MGNGTVNAHWAFNEAPKKNDFLTAIKVEDSDDSALRRAREEIRAELRAGLRKWESVVAKTELFEREFVRTAQPAPSLRPKFRMQGSFTYRTVNDPAQKPPQQVDLDDGMYMPTEYVLIQGHNRPILASKGYFRAVEGILAPLCKRNGWTLNEKKNSCVRIEISNQAHVDLPLYAIPAKQFAQMTESIRKSLGMDSARALSESEELVEEFYRALSADQLMLAHRKNGWHPSDPRKIEDWFHRAVEIHGEVLRRICRYLKAWRDHHWHDAKLSSLAIMVCVVDIFDQLNVDLPNSRDDLAMLLVTERFSARVSRAIPNPVMTDVAKLALDFDWTAADRAQLVMKAKELHQRIAEALQGSDRAEVTLAQLRGALGDRMTDDVSVIRFEQREATIKSYPKVAVAAPLVGRTTSG